MNLLILGPQGSGKGTQAEMLEKKYGFNYFEMGKVLRSISESNEIYAKTVKEYMDKGLMVPDEYVRLIAREYINKADPRKGIIFDGYPRSVEQYDYLKVMLSEIGQKIDKVIYISVSESEVIRRISARRTCNKCGNIYNLITNPSPNGEKCECGGELKRRADDQPEAIKKRLEWGWNKAVKDRARDEGILLEVDGEKPIENVYKEIAEHIRDEK